MPYCIKVSNLENQTAWEKKLTAEEFKRVKTYVKGCDSINIFSASFKPVRTNNFQNFAKDFFLPTFVNHAIKVQHTVGKVFAILGALILDTLTFPIRLFNCIPRIISNTRQEENALKKYLISEDVDPKLLESDHLKVRLEWEKASQYPTSSWATHDGVRHSEYSPEQHWSEENIRFIELPVNLECDIFSAGS